MEKSTSEVSIAFEPSEVSVVLKPKEESKPEFFLDQQSELGPKKSDIKSVQTVAIKPSEEVAIRPSDEVVMVPTPEEDAKQKQLAVIANQHREVMLLVNKYSLILPEKESQPEMTKLIKPCEKHSKEI